MKKIILTIILLIGMCNITYGQSEKQISIGYTTNKEFNLSVNLINEVYKNNIIGVGAYRNTPYFIYGHVVLNRLQINTNIGTNTDSKEFYYGLNINLFTGEKKNGIVYGITIDNLNRATFNIGYKF